MAIAKSIPNVALESAGSSTVLVSVHAGATAAPAAHPRESIYAFPTIALPLPWAHLSEKKNQEKSGL